MITQWSSYWKKGRVILSIANDDDDDDDDDNDDNGDGDDDTNDDNDDDTNDDNNDDTSDDDDFVDDTWIWRPWLVPLGVTYTLQLVKCPTSSSS